MLGLRVDEGLLAHSFLSLISELSLSDFLKDKIISKNDIKILFHFATAWMCLIVR